MHVVQDAVFGGDEDHGLRAALVLPDPVEHAGGRADVIGPLEHRQRAFRVGDQEAFAGYGCQRFVQRGLVELVVYFAHGGPERHVVAVLEVQVGAHVAVGRENDLFALGVQVGNDVVDVAAGDDPVRQCLVFG